MFMNVHRLCLTAQPDKVILSILILLFAEPVLLRFPILIVLPNYGILSVLLSQLVVSLVYNLLSSLYIKLCSPLWLTEHLWGGKILHMNISNDLSLWQVEVTVSTTSTFLYFWLSSTSIMASNNAHACFRKCSQRGTRRQKFYSHMCETTQLKLSFQHFTKKIYLLLQHLSLLHSTLCPLPDLTQLFEMKFRWYLLLLLIKTIVSPTTRYQL